MRYLYTSFPEGEYYTYYSGTYTIFTYKINLKNYDTK